MKTLDDPLFPSMKTCKRCGDSKPTSRENWYMVSAMRTFKRMEVDEDGWEYSVRDRMKVTIPSTYCRVCSNELKAAQARLRRKLETAPPDLAHSVRVSLRGQCDICGRQMTNRREVEGTVACQRCVSMMAECGADLDQAKVIWRKWFRHNSLTKQAMTKAREMTDSPRINEHVMVKFYFPDETWIGEDQQYNSHSLCLLFEAEWLRLVRWMQNGTIGTVPVLTVVD